MKKIVGIGLAIGVGVVIYDYLSQREIDWIRAVIIAIVASVILFLFEKVKKKDEL